MKKLALTLAAIIGLSNAADAKTLIAYFSRSGTNYGVGYVERGNTQVLAEYIAGEVNGDLFRIEREAPYPEDYDECVKEAEQEKDAKAFPTLKADKDISEYDTIYLGYPIWYGSYPRSVATFLQAHDWNGKTIIPFATHEGSGLSNTESEIKDACAGATVLSGFSMYGSVAQALNEDSKQQVQTWLNK